MLGSCQGVKQNRRGCSAEHGQMQGQYNANPSALKCTIHTHHRMHKSQIRDFRARLEYKQDWWHLKFQGCCAAQRDTDSTQPVSLRFIR